MNHKKISIGTAQFGSKYGITNNKILSMNEIKKILNFAFKNKINSIDTAAAYGNAEEKLGKIGLKGWNVSSKFPSIPIMEYGEEWIEINLLKSLMKLKKENLDTFFVHDISQIHNFQSAKKIFIALSKLKQQGLIKKIGISIYSMKKLDKIINDFEIDVIQSPANILNNEIFNNKLNYLLKKKNIDLEIRSIFLQGLLLENPKNIPTKFRKFNSVFNSVHELSKINKISKISLALSFLKNKLYKKVIFGVASQSQLKKILKNSQIMQINLPNFKFKDKNILTNPSLW